MTFHSSCMNYFNGFLEDLGNAKQSNPHTEKEYL